MTTPAQLSDDQFADQLAQRLAVIEQRLTQIVQNDNPFISQAANHLIAAGGKRFRPGLLVACSHFGGVVTEEDLIGAALVIELTHVASLYHDDVMDEAQLRRAAESANARFGNSIAILVGDYLFARASRVVADLGPAFVAVQADTFAELVRGQIAETKGPGAGEDPVAHHYSVIAGKTASLIRAAALFGAMVSGADEATTAALGDFGYQIGMVFQMSDDLIDITSDVTGKTPGTDLREGVPTLPTLLLQVSQNPVDKELWVHIQGDLADDAVLADVLAQLRANPAIEQVRAEITSRAEQARQTLAPLPQGAAKRALLKLCDEVVARSS